MRNAQRSIRTDDAPAAIGPYNQAIVIDDLGLVFTSGQIGLDPTTGNLVPGGVEAECARALDNLEAVLRSAVSGLDSAIRATLYLLDLDEFGKVNEVYARRVGEPLPARSTVGVAALPKGARIEIDLIARVRPDESAPR